MVQSETRTKSASNFDRALEFYHEKIKHELTDADKGRFIAIDPNSGAWEIGEGFEVAEALRNRIPDVIPSVIRHVYIATNYWGTLPPEVLEQIETETRDADWVNA